MRNELLFTTIALSSRKVQRGKVRDEAEFFHWIFTHIRNEEITLLFIGI